MFYIELSQSVSLLVTLFSQHAKTITKYLSAILPVSRYVVAEWYEAGLCDRKVAGSTPARGCCVPTPTRRAIPLGSVNE